MGLRSVGMHRRGRTCEGGHRDFEVIDVGVAVEPPGVLPFQQQRVQEMLVRPQTPLRDSGMSDWLIDKWNVGNETV